MTAPTRRVEPVVKMPQRLSQEVGGVVRQLEDVLGKMVSFADIAMFLEHAGVTFTDATGFPGFAITPTRMVVNFGDAGVDSARLVVRGKNSAAGGIEIDIFDVTNNVMLGGSGNEVFALITGTSEQTGVGPWRRIVPTGLDQEIEVRVGGNDADDPILYAVHLQLRTTQARA